MSQAGARLGTEQGYRLKLGLDAPVVHGILEVSQNYGHSSRGLSGSCWGYIGVHRVL